MTISHAERAENHETTEDNFQPPGTQSPLSKAPTAQLGRLKSYLEVNFPDELLRVTQHGEATVDVAIRLLASLHAYTPPGQVQRCDQPYCNRPLGHKDICGWVQGG